jgi:molybdopterin-synthase adenylyltransferase
LLERYSRNIATLSFEENEKLQGFRAVVVGCGGIGGYVIEMLGRLGIGRITAIDGDVFQESNLNRQILSSEETLGQKKSLIAKSRMEKINPFVKVEAVTQPLTAENGKLILEGADVVVDALDSIITRVMLEELCQELNIPLVHGAIGGWYGQITTVLPGDGTLRRFYSGRSSEGIEKKLGNPSFTPALVASIEVSEVVKLLIGKGEILRRKMLFIDLLEQEFEVIEL